MKGGQIMILRQMEYFLAAVCYKSFSEAAKQCFVSQPAFSFQIKQLEEELGVKLINRNNCSFSLTPAGEKFYIPCKKIMGEIQSLKQNMYHEAEKSSIQQYKIGCRASYNVHTLLSTINRLNKHSLSYHIDLIYGDHDELMNMLENNELDIVVSSDRNYQIQSLQCELLESLSLAVFLPQHSKLASKDMVDIEDLKEHTCCLIVDKQYEEQEKTSYQQLLNFNGPFYISNDLLSALTKVINSMDSIFLPIISNNNAQIFGSGLTKLLPLTINHQPVSVDYKIFWINKSSAPEIENIVYHILALIQDH